MTNQLRNAMAAAGPDAVQAVRLRLIAAGDEALRHSSVRCLIYGAAASATADRTPGDDVDPILIGAVAYADRVQQGCASAVMAELIETGEDEDDPVTAAIGREVLLACCEVYLALNRAQAELDDFHTLRDWPA